MHRGIRGSNSISVDLDRVLTHGKSKADTTRSSIARVGYSVEGLKDLTQFRLWDAFSPIQHANYNLGISSGVLATQRNLDGGAFVCIRNGIAHHILDGTPQQLLITFYRAAVSGNEPGGAVATPRFEIGINHYFRDEALQINCYIVEWRATAQPCQLEQLANQVVQSISFALDTIQSPSSLLSFALTRQLQSYSQASQ